MSRLRQTLIWKIALPVPLALLVTVLAVVWFIPKQIEEDTQSTVVENALHTISHFRSVRDYYNTTIIPKIRSSADLKATHLHAADPKGVPIPTTFILDMSKRLQNQGVSLHLYSPYPFLDRDKRQSDDFERTAWEKLQKTPDIPHVARATLNGMETIRVAVGDRMAEGCVACHNTHPQSPKKDWKVGDVRGIFEIRTTIDSQLVRGQTLTSYVLGIIGVTSFVVLIVSLLATRTVALPLRRVCNAVNQLASGERRLILGRDSARKDEIGALARTLEKFGLALERQEALGEQEIKQAAERAELERKAARQQELTELTRNFDRAISALLGKLDGMTHQLDEAAITMNETVEKANNTFTTISDTTTKTHASVEATADAAEELLASNATIADRVREALSISRKAVINTETVDSQITHLSNTVERIANAGRLIHAIAGQTNLLALNATIEAVRAGKAGAGFTVVATEVKSLANQTAHATEEIASQIAAIRAGTHNTIEAVREVRGVIEGLERLATDISNSVERQESATSEIAQQMQDAAKGTRSATAEVQDIASTVDGALHASATVHNSVANLNVESLNLQQLVHRFLAEVRQQAG